MIDNKLCDLLHSSDITLSPQQQDALARHLALVREWNRLVSVVSAGDLNHIEDRHLADSLSLAPVILHCAPNSGMVLDIGSGGGFPAIPLAIVLPEWTFTLVERSVKKMGFLRKVQGALGLTNLTLVTGEFPNAVTHIRPNIITARAVETPNRLYPALEGFLSEGAVFLCQTGNGQNAFGKRFHVEPWSDAWSLSGIRRGTLDLIYSPPTNHP